MILAPNWFTPSCANALFSKTNANFIGRYKSHLWAGFLRLINQTFLVFPSHRQLHGRLRQQQQKQKFHLQSKLLNSNEPNHVLSLYGTSLFYFLRVMPLILFFTWTKKNNFHSSGCLACCVSLTCNVVFFIITSIWHNTMQQRQFFWSLFSVHIISF